MQLSCLRDQKPWREYACSDEAPSSTLFVGDSTMTEHFASMVHLLDAENVSRNQHRKSVVSAMRARVCNSTKTIDFSRSDLFSLSTPLHQQLASTLRTGLHPQDFWCRIRDASLAVVSFGHHFSVHVRRDAERGVATFARRAVESLTRVQDARRIRGHDPRSLVVFGLRAPKPNCTGRSASAVDAYGWEHLATLDRHLREAARASNATFLPIQTTFSARRDAALGNVKADAHDCLHTCLPGPVDSWNAWMWHTLRERGVPFVQTRALAQNESECARAMARECSIRSEADCLCSSGCTSPLWGCKPSHLCDASVVERGDGRRTAIVVSLVFDSRFVRNRFRANATAAYLREYRRAQHMISSLRTVNTSLPIVVMVGGERRPELETQLAAKSNVRIRNVTFVRPPRWASRWHRLSFEKLAALELVEYERVIVLDNDMVALRNFDVLATVPGPAAVFHPDSKAPGGFVVSGLLLLEPSRSEHERARRHLDGMNYTSAAFDGGDEEFWSSFYPTWWEVPIEFHARFRMNFPAERWSRVRLFHAISNFAGDTRSLPSAMRNKLRYF